LVAQRFFESITQPSDYAVGPTSLAAGYGKVFKAFEQTGAQRQVAVKRLARTDSSGGKARSFAEGHIVVASFREILCLLPCPHPTVLPALGFMLTPHDESPFFHVTPYMENRLVAGPLSGVDDTKRLKIAYRVARGMEHLHRMEILHRDLKLDSIFWDGIALRIADLDGQRWSGPHAIAGTGNSGDTAPKVLDLSARYDLSAHVYSYAICLWEVITGK
jgi:serine/threonine protein kinase